MIVITYDRRRGTLTADGHSGAAPAGQDIVCAAVSTVMDLTAMMMPGRSLELECWTGFESLHARGIGCRRIFDRAVMYLETLAQIYPDNVKVVRL